MAQEYTDEGSCPRDDVLRHTERPAWDDYFMEIAHVVAKRSTCLSRQVGCVLVRDRRILATGYNGPPKGLAHCEDHGGCLRASLGIPRGQRQEVCRALHAEQNAIIQAAVHGVSLQGQVICYCLTQPCVTCAKMLSNCSVTRIVFRDPYPDELAQEMLQEAGVQLVRWSAAEGAQRA
jgi:dCMP deaminase